MYKSLSKINDIRIYFLLFSFPKLLERPNYFNVPSLYFRAFLEGDSTLHFTQIVSTRTFEFAQALVRAATVFVRCPGQSSLSYLA